MEDNLTEQVEILTKGIFGKYENLLKENVSLTEEKMETNSKMIEESVKLVTAQS